MSTYISMADTAKFIRKAVKESFPGIKFSVRCRAGGSSITVEWTDGPTTKSVDKVVKVFEGASFDGMYDLKTYKNSTLNGEEVQFGADYVITHRKTTRAFVEAIIAAFCERWGRDVSEIAIRGTDQEARPDAWNLGRSEDHFFNELFDTTDAKDMHRPYEAAEERKQAQEEEYRRTAPQRKAQQDKEFAEQAKRDEVRRQQEQAQAKARAEQEQRREREQAARRTPTIQTRAQALAYLGLPQNATSQQIREAFRAKVKGASDGRGGYKGDMDKLTMAKELALR